LTSLSDRPGLELELVAGGDADTRSLIDRCAAELALPARVHGLVPTLGPLMDRAHVVVTKAGGLVVSECLARGRPLILPWPAAGQERGNLRRAVAVGAAVALDDPRELGRALHQLAAQPARRATMASAAARAGVRGASDRIARDLMQDLDGSDAGETEGRVQRLAVGGAR
jgi:processive 1,2-diacylglycerol beta-glucosyltransferase